MDTAPARKNEHRGFSVRVLLCSALILLFLWLSQAQTASAARPPCEASTGTVSSLLLSPLFFYSWLTSNLAKVVLAMPALVLSSLYHSLLLLLAGPWALLCLWVTLALTWLQVLVYLLHLTLALGVVVALAARTPYLDD